MKLGMNLAGLTSADGAYPFSNLVWTSGAVGLIGGAATWTQDQGIITVTEVTSSPAIFQFWISDAGSGLASGSYPTLNPNGHEIGVGTGSGLTDLTDGYVTGEPDVAYTAGNPLYLTIRVTAPGTYSGVALLLPGSKAAWQGGDYLSADFKAYYATMQSPVLRFMDWTRANYNSDIDWTDRPVTTKTALSCPSGYDATAPWELVISTANALSKDPWINMPARSSQGYVDSAAALFAADLDPGRAVWLEHGNELMFNYNGIFGAGYTWMEFYTHTKVYASVNAATRVITKVGHNLTTGDILSGWATRATREKMIYDRPGGTSYFAVTSGTNVYVERLTDDTFKVYYDVGRTVDIDWPTGVTDWVYVLQNEAGKSRDRYANYMLAVLRDVAAFDAALGASRVKAIASSHAASAAVTESLLAQPGATRLDHIAIAPYMFPLWMGAAVDIASGQFTPKAWSNAGSPNLPEVTMTVHFGVYAAGSTPTTAQVVAGTGTGRVGGGSFAQSYVASTYTAGSAVTGLANGTSYKVYFVFADSRGYRHVLSETIAASASASTTTLTDSYANQAMRCKVSIDSDVDGVILRIRAHKAAIAASAHPTVKLINYEGGLHLDETAPTIINDWMIAYTESAEHGDVMKQYVKAMAAEGEQAHMVFSDVSALALSWSSADSYADRGDERFLAMSSFAGYVPIRTALGLEDATGTELPTDPGTFPTPTTIYTFPNAALTYTITKGNDAGNFQMTGNVLQMVNDIGIDWANPAQNSIEVYATDGHLSENAVITFSTGQSAIYESDAVFFLNMTEQADLTTLTATIGGDLPRTTGSAGSFSGGLLDCEGANEYFSATGLSTALGLTVPTLFAFIIDKDDQATNFQITLQIGQGDNVALYFTGGGSNVVWNYFTGGVDLFSQSIDISDNNPCVVWMLLDKGNLKAYAGKNTTELTTAGGVSIPSGWGSSISRAVLLNPTQDRKGSIEVVPRSGLTVSAVTGTIVPKLKTLHSI